MAPRHICVYTNIYYNRCVCIYNITYIYYGTQAQHAEEDVENYRTRAKDWEAEEKQNSKDVKTWEDVRHFLPSHFLLSLLFPSRNS